MEIKLKKRFKYAGDVYAELLKNAFTPSYASELIDKVPDADVAPVVHGKWEHTHTSESYFNECWRCSACGFDDTEGFVFEFCPHCGAKMDLEG